MTSARAIATRCCSPPLSLSGKSSARLAKPTASQERARPLRAAALTAQFTRQGDVFEDGQRGDQVKKLEDDADVLAAEKRQAGFVQLGDVHVVDDERAAVSLIDAAQQVEQRAFPAAAFAEQDEEFAFPNVEVNRVQHSARALAFSIEFAESANLNDLPLV